MEEIEHLHVIGVGTAEDWEAGTGSFYYIEDRNGEKALPVFTTSEASGQYIGRIQTDPRAHMDMLESAGLIGAPALTKGNFVVMPFSAEGIAKVAAKIGADYLIRDPRPGREQEILRFSE